MPSSAIAIASVASPGPRARPAYDLDALVLFFSNIVICLVAVVLYVAVNEFEPNRRLASALKDRNRRGRGRGNTSAI